MRNIYIVLSIIFSTYGVIYFINRLKILSIFRAAFIIYISYSLCGVDMRCLFRESANSNIEGDTDASTSSDSSAAPDSNHTRGANAGIRRS